MPRKLKPSAKSAPKTSNSYPNPLPPSLQSHPPPSAPNSKPSSNSSYDAQLADWTAKNARAKAIIMSTLVPGSEPWQIAEPLEYAADIWRALEERYGPKSEGRDGGEDDALDEENFEQITERRWEDKLIGHPPAAAKDGLAQEASGGLQEAAELWTREQEKDDARADEINAGMTEGKRKWNSDSMRDQRFLWALLNGGKEGEFVQSSETKDQAIGDAG